MVTLNRSAVVIRPKQPFLEWLHGADPTSRHIALEELSRDPAIYLVPEADDTDDAKELLREMCGQIFTEQLESWIVDRRMWPKDRGFDAFCCWFDFQHHSMLIDLCDEPLIREI